MLVGQVGGRAAEPAQVVESDHRIRPLHLDLGVQVAQQPVAQAVGQRPQLLLGILDHRAQRGLPRHHPRPIQTLTDRQCHRIFRGEPAHRARQIHPRGDLLVPPVTLHVDTDRRATTHELRAGQPERNQQNVLHPSVKRRRHLPQQQPGGLHIQRRRQLPLRGIGVIGPHRRQHRRRGHHLLPRRRRSHHCRALGVLGQNRRPPRKRRARHRQRDLLTAVMLRPGDVDVLDQRPPRHPVNRQVVNDQGQFVGGACPYRGQHQAGAGVQPGPRPRQRGLGEHVDRAQDGAGVNRTGGRHVQVPAAGAVVVEAQPQHRVPVQQCLQHHRDVVDTDPGGRGQHHGLVELVDRAVDVLQPAHDRGGLHRPDPLVGGAQLAVDSHLGHPRQPGHRLLDEHVARPTDHPRRAGAGHHLHGQDAVAAQVEERVVHPDPLHAQHLGVDVGQDLLDRVAGRPVFAGGVFRRGQRALVQLAVAGQRQRVQHHHRGRDHVGRQPVGQLRAQLGRVGGAGDVADQALVAGPVLAGDHRRLLHPVQTGQHRLGFAELDAEAADLDLLVGAAQVLQLPVGAPAHQVAGAVHPRAGGAERVGHEPRGGQAGPAHVAVPHAAAGQVQLAHHAGGHRLQPLVEHEHRRPGDRRADRHHRVAGRQRCADGRAHRGLGRAVGVQHHPTGRRPPVDHVGRAGLAGHH
ncbi:hypothetical protein PICSAR120_04295 [Mycobacterium avium subsp. paratuberculosis]|nr:hypothetical protein PICSAR120_04295 [Mycobacterium avium subsp. paratuberculosis]CAG6934255.1 hypothetical protein PICSAR107_04318 [Mycobacterium avium subsp. paratuberculosis]CAG6938117.1 hypothetical protein PICSAR10_04468 [Mycobacterium avium subsp. paratuberculosis]CAG6982555.1 hypothetical protein PICSAR164_01850 [Mycobacterium avium subsp. paratuberculosis]CAG6987552.1 hypothetical protein PICSAR14_02621 [Mycobacterium avium subsp. paratuberculosis]